MVIKAFEDGILPLSTESHYKKQAEEKEEAKKRKADLKEFTAKIYEIETGGINKTAFENCFDYKIPSSMVKDLVNSDKEENISLVT